MRESRSSQSTRKGKVLRCMTKNDVTKLRWCSLRPGLMHNGVIHTLRTVSATSGFSGSSETVVSGRGIDSKFISKSMKANQINQLHEEIKRGHKILRRCSYDDKSRRLKITLSRGVDEGSAPVVIERATPTEGLTKLVGQEIYGVRFYHRLDHTEVHLDFGPTISFTIQDEPETKPHKQESKT